METHEQQFHSTYRDVGALFDWQPDLDRFDREIAASRGTGRGDPLTLAEMECSLDLLEAELIGLKARPKTDDSAASIAATSRLVARLTGQIAMMRRFVRE